MLKTQLFSARNYFEITVSLSSDTLAFVVYFKMFMICVSLIKGFIYMPLWNRTVLTYSSLFIHYWVESIF